MIDDDGSADEDLIGGVVRDVVGRGVRRDVVSISGSGGHGRRIRDVLVENVRCYESALRGAVEVSDGTDQHRLVPTTKMLRERLRHHR